MIARLRRVGTAVEEDAMPLSTPIAELADETIAEPTDVAVADAAGADEATPTGDSAATQAPPVNSIHDEEPHFTGVRHACAATSWSRVLVYGALPALALLLAIAAGWLKWQDCCDRAAGAAGKQAVQTATDSTVALLSYRADTVEKELGAARDRLTGTFRDAYTRLTRDVVIPGAKQKQISAVATVPAAALVSASENHAVVLLAVNQSVVVGNDAPSDTASSVRVTLDNIGGHWLISDFSPV